MEKPYPPLKEPRSQVADHCRGDKGRELMKTAGASWKVPGALVRRLKLWRERGLAEGWGRGEGLLVTAQLGDSYSWKPPFHWLYSHQGCGE